MRTVFFLAALLVPALAADVCGDCCKGINVDRCIALSCTPCGPPADTTCETCCGPDGGKLAICERVRCDCSPYNIKLKIPDKIEAEDFDGGAGKGYFDKTPTNLGNGNHRPGEGVDIGKCARCTKDKNSGFSVGYIEVGEWMEYTVQVGATGIYIPSLTIATPNSAKRTVATIAVLPGLCKDVDPVCATGVPIVSTGTGKYGVFKSFSAREGLRMEAGPACLRICGKATGFSIDNITFTGSVKPQQ